MFELFRFATFVNGKMKKLQIQLLRFVEAPTDFQILRISTIIYD